ncbi:hypothetical protein HF878_10725 [Selenomonas bovis]|uniref:Uncharacterized protein n=1 Tax=Selenomonas bovis TaxID=416586 RepID=A0A848BDG0_9FIRM|nr:hypothetical protein [Selenomonas bovis]NMD99915.1 hypothetical protein [Selenomonas bovis]
MKENLDKLVQKYIQMKPLSDNDAVTARREYARRELEHWQDIFEHGCSDPAWPDGCNLNLTRNHIIAALSGLRDLGEDTSGEYVPPEVANGLMIPAGRRFKVRYDRFEQEGQRLQIAGAEISLF